jgi:cell division septation protein DedD
MSALNVTQAEADVLVDSLKMFAEVHKNAYGSVPAEVADLLVKLTATPEPVAEEAPAPKARKSKAATSEDE